MLTSSCATAIRGLSTSAQLSKVNNLTIIGAGLMGSGIAQVSANAKINVTVVDSSQAALDKAQKGILNSIQRVAKKKHANDAAAQSALVSSVVDRIKVSTSVTDSVKDADLVIEAIIENIDIKRKVFAEVEAAIKPTALIVSNTSSLCLEDIGLNLKDKTRFGGLHFFNPVPMMKLLEVVRHAETSDETFQQLVEYGQSVGKTTVACKDTPGFIVNRLLVPYMFEALRLYERGDASKEDIDVAMKLGAGHPMGPFELADYVGLDTIKFIMDGWNKKYPDDVNFRPSEFLNSLVKDGKTGRKSGEGFFKYE
uniref:3-hydroxyacyl-CoA dehydrogenase n=1 Tax=Caenorhabditis japonica TaxID=281687 RepID=A0A8R1I334_CAEJA